MGSIPTSRAKILFGFVSSQSRRGNKKGAYMLYLLYFVIAVITTVFSIIFLRENAQKEKLDHFESVVLGFTMGSIWPFTIVIAALFGIGKFILFIVELLRRFL